MERSQPPRARRAHPLRTLLCAHSRRDRIGGSTDQLPPIPSWPLAVHANGFVAELPTVKRDLTLAVNESLFPEISGQSDTELLFYLALTFGLEDDPPQAVAGAVGLVEAVGERKGVRHPFQGTVATTDGAGH